ncbi:MAG: hypothetical protein ACYDBQ_02120 [Thermoplasmatota archaeon]
MERKVRGQIVKQIGAGPAAQLEEAVQKIYGSMVDQMFPPPVDESAKP